MDINKNINDFINGLGAMAETAGIYRDKLIQNGFTREEAVKISGDFIIAIASPNRSEKN